MIQLYVAVARFVDLANCAARNGGIYITSSGGTCIRAAETIAAVLKTNLQDTIDMIEYHVEQVTGDDVVYWWSDLQHQSPSNIEDARFDIRTVAKAALRGI